MKRVTRREKRGQQKERGEDILYVGCDIGSENHALAIINGEGKVLERIPKVYNNRKGFDYLLGKIESWAQKTGAERIRFGFEPTGHYWKTIIYFLSERGIEVVFIKTTAIKAMRELTDSTQSKNDTRDAVTLAHLLREGKVLLSPPPEGIWRELRDLVKYRQRLAEEKSALLLRLRAIISTFFPELTEIFNDMNAVGLSKLLECAPFPEDLLGKGQEWLETHLRRWTRRGKSAERKAELLMEAARSSVGLPPGTGDRVRLASTLRLLEHYRAELRVVEKELERALAETGYAEILLSFPGIGVISASYFLGELGNPENFESAGQVVSFAGLDPSERSSGKRSSRHRISKKGRPILRTALYFMALSAIQNCPELRAYYARRKKEIEMGKLDLVPMQLIMAVAIKEVRILFAMCRDGKTYETRVSGGDIAVAA